MTDLFEAIEAGDEDRARELAAARPELREERDGGGLLPALRALYVGRAALARELLPPDDRLDAAAAATFDRTERLGELLDEDPARVDALSPDGFSPLHLACFGRAAGARRLLIERGADLETLSQADFARVRPIGTAAFTGDADAVRDLLDAGADPNGTGEGGATALHTAAANGDLELVALLLERGAEPARALDDGRIPEQLAREAGHTEAADALATAGAP